jgi:hypothetical protein
MRGNRDFLIDVPMGNASPWTVRIGASLLDDPCIVELFGERVLLGPWRCAVHRRWRPHQQLRTMLRDRAWQAQFWPRPLAERVAFARDLRGRSEHDKADKADYLMDVNPLAIETAMRSSKVRTMIHGDTHRPAGHRFTLDGRWRPAGGCCRTGGRARRARRHAAGGFSGSGCGRRLGLRQAPAGIADADGRTGPRRGLRIAPKKSSRHERGDCANHRMTPTGLNASVSEATLHHAFPCLDVPKTPGRL